MNSDAGKGAHQVFQSEDLRPAEAEVMRIPYWVRLERKGNTITGYYSRDGKDWKTHERATTTGKQPAAGTAHRTPRQLDGVLRAAAGRVRQRNHHRQNIGAVTSNPAAHASMRGKRSCNGINEFLT
jgi:hypothetical protein